MRTMLPKWAILVFLTVISVFPDSTLRASHIVGGEMTYRCLGGQVYEISLTLRRDCFNGSPEAEFDDPAHLGIFDSEGAPIRNIGQFGLLLLDFRNDDTLNEILRTECEVVGGDVCVHTTTYRGKIELPFRQGGYIIAYQRCCRNKTITNIVEPELIGATYSITISEDALRYCNSAPKFGAFPPIYICGDRVIQFDHSAIDANGDSLVYSLCVPYAGADTANSKPTRPSKPPFPLVEYKPPFSLNDLLGGVPALRIDPHTGLITGQPNAIGQYLIGICVDEYRNGRLLSRVRRDFQYNVRFCTTNPVSNFEPDNSVLCVGDSTVKFTNKSVNSKAFTWYFDYPNTNYFSNDTNPSFTFPKPGKYKVALIAVRATDCIDTNYKDIFVYDENLLGSDFRAQYGSCDDSIEIQLNDLSFDSLLQINQWNWSAQLNNRIFTSTQQNPKFIFSDTGRLSVWLYVTSSGGCRDSINKEFQLNRLKPRFLSDKIPICIGESTQLISNPDPRFQYNWSPATDLSCSNCPNPTASPSSDVLYRVTITDGNCYEEDSVLVKVSVLLDMDITGDTVICSDDIELHAVGGVENSVEWSDASDFSTILKSGSFDFNTSINGRKTFYVRAKSMANCPGSDSITVENQKVLIQTALDSLVVCEDDTFGLILNNLRPEHQISSTWFPDSLLIEGQGTSQIKGVIPECGTYSFSVRSTNQFGCEADDSVQVRVICKPGVDFRVDKNCDNTLVAFINASSPGGYSWDFGDGNQSNENSPVHLYAKPGRYTITLNVSAECKNQITKVIDVGFIMADINERVVSCMGAPVKLNENADTIYNYEWSPATGLDDPNSPNPTATVSQTTQYKVRIIDKTIPDCFIERTVTVFVPPMIDLRVNSDTVLCYTDSLMLQAYTDAGAVVANIDWTDEIGILLGRGYQLTKTFRDSMYIFAYATDIYGCSEKDSFRIVPVITDFKLNGKVNLCPGADGFIEFINNDGHQYKLNWTPGRFIVSDPTLPRILVKPTDTTIFYLSILNEYGCSFSDSFQVNISRFDPPLQAYAEDDTIYLGQSTVLHVSPGYSNYLWRIPYNLSCTDCTDPVASPQFSTLYTVQAKNEDGCEGETDVRVIVIRPKCDSSDIFMPNAFSPNDDRENDILEVRSNFLESVELYVYNRWGEKVFETRDKTQWWDGSYKGQKLPPDVYGYYLKVICVDGQQYSEKGNVTLIK
ncbi:MAG TPA: PKD domain-containing protein [Saprospiraceae bacterium]|nr:PKD domain-containing protein [Saprospiraceae bacterium]